MPDLWWLIVAALWGAVTAAIVIILALLYFYLNYGSISKIFDSNKVSRFTLPDDLMDAITKGGGATAEGVMNAALQFFFQQRYVHTRWVRKRIGMELDELLTKSGKLFDSLKLRDLGVGSEFPVISNLKIVGGELEADQTRMNSLDIEFDVKYTGHCRIDVDAVMLLGKQAYISFTVINLSGRVRFMLRTAPYTHWAIAFVKAPHLEMVIRGRLQGKMLRSRLAELVAAQIRRAIMQKHTLPNYKIRYKPIFPKTEPGEPSIETEEYPTPSGKLSVRLIEVTRLFGGGDNVRVSMAVDSHGWVSLQGEAVVLDTVVSSAGNGLGLVCCQGIGIVIVDSVMPMSPAYRADLRRDDIVLAVDNKAVNNVAQVTKLLKAVENRSVIIRIKRGAGVQTRLDAVDRRSFPTFSLRRVSEVLEGRLQVIRPSMSSNHPTQDTESSDTGESEERVKESEVSQGPDFGLRKRRCSVENKSPESSPSSTPSQSGSNTPQKVPTAIKIVPIITTDSSECRNNVEEENLYQFSGGPRQQEHVEICQMFSTKTVAMQSIMEFDEQVEFKLNENHKYLNLNVWSKLADESEETLLGYLNIPIGVLLVECQKTTVLHQVKRYKLLPPEVEISFSKIHPLASHSGFEPGLCFGDALLKWKWDEEKSLRPKDGRVTLPLVIANIVTTNTNKHDFIRTHFNKSTQCGFCNKKIWLKDALECCVCKLRCHKKCVNKCQGTLSCDAARESSETNYSSEGLPDPDSEEEVIRKTSLDVYDEAGGAVSALVAGLRRAGSAHSLCAPRPSASSRSLPPSPCHTPRKQSLVSASPFSGCGTAWLKRSSVSEVLAPVLRSNLPPDALLAAARDTAPELVAALTLPQIHDMLSAVREELSAEDSVGGEAGEMRACALTALMLHCCAAAQIAQQRADQT